MLDPDAAEPERSIETPLLRLVFGWSDDRWIHWIEVGPAGARRAIGWTIESDPEATDLSRLVSPVFQELEPTVLDDGRTALLVVGRHGSHHLSAVVRAMHAEDGASRIRVEAADRCRAPVVAVASTYRVDRTSGDLRGADATGAEWDLPDEGLRLRFEGTAPTSVAIHESGRRMTSVQAVAAVEGSKATLVWTYEWVVERV